MASKNSMVRNTINKFNYMVLYNKINNVFNKLGNLKCQNKK